MLYKHFTNANVDVSALAIGTWGTGELESYGYVEKEDGKVTTKGIMKLPLIMKSKRIIAF